MIGKYHSQITTEALNSSFNDNALNYIEKGNLDSDNLRRKIPDITDGFDLSAQHFNKASLEKCDDFLEKAEDVVVDDFIQAAKAKGEDADEYYEQAFYDLGRLVHNIQDFYSHSNWVNLNQDEIWNEDIKNPNINGENKLKTGEYSYFSQFIDKINPFYKWFAAKNYEDMYEGTSTVSHYGLNKDEPNTIADRIYKEKYGTSAFDLAEDFATAHTKEKWEEINSALREELTTTEYNNLSREIANFNLTEDDFNNNLQDLRKNFNEDMKEAWKFILL